MKIVYLTDQIYLHGGVEKVLSQKANYLADISTNEVTIITYRQQDKQPVYNFSKKIKLFDLKINYEISKSYFHPANLYRALIHRKMLDKALRNLQPDVVISCSIGPDFYFLPFVCSKIPKIKEFHATRYFSSTEKRFKKIALQKLNNFIEKSYAQLVILNEDERKFYNSSNVSVIPNPAAVDSPPSNLLSKKIIAAGRITYQKNFEDLICVGQMLFKEFPEWQIHIYGDDYLGRQKILQAKINELGLSENIIFKGVSQDLKKTFLDYSIFAMTSNHETFPMVLLEALSVGLPVVSYDCPTGPSRILISGQDSFLVPYKDVTIFVDKLKIIIKEENLRRQMGNSAVKNIQRFRIERIMDEWTSLFSSLLN